MSLNHIVKNGLKDVSLDVKDLNCESITVNNLPIESFDQDLNTTDDVRFNQIRLTSTMFTDPDQCVSKQYVDNSAPGLGSLQSAYDGGNTILTAPGFPVDIQGSLDANIVNTTQVISSSNLTMGSANQTQILAQSLLLTTPQVTVSGQTSTNQTTFPDPQNLVTKNYVDTEIANIPSATLQSAYEGGNTILTAPGFPVELTGTEGVNLNSNPITTGKLTFPNSQELVSRQYVDDQISVLRKTTVLFNQSTDYLVVNGGFYTDGIITLGWDATTQTEFLINTLPATGGATVSTLIGGTSSSIVATQANFKYDIGGAVPSSGVLQSWVHSNLDTTYPNYYITILRVGGGENSILTVEKY